MLSPSNLLYFIILIGVLVFVHELGHFMFAKLFKVKVQVFSLGFGPKLFGFTKGETEYKICLFPLGGYVKMLGEDSSEEITPDDEGRAFSDKAVWQQFLILVAGPVMNIIFPLFLFFGVGLTNTQVIPALVGEVIAEYPAEKAGIQVDDKIVAINDKPIYAFGDLTAAVQPNPGVALKVTVERDGKLIHTTLVPKPEERVILMSEKETIGLMGVRPAYRVSTIGITDHQGIAAKAGLKTFDLITSVKGKPVAKYAQLQKALLAAQGQTVELQVRSAIGVDKRVKPVKSADEAHVETTRKVDLPIPAGITSLNDLGINDGANFVFFVKPGGAADKLGIKPGDKIEAFNNQQMTMFAMLQLLNKNKKSTFPLKWSRDGVSFEKDFALEFIPADKARKDLGIGNDIYDIGFKTILAVKSPPQIDNPRLIYSAYSDAVAHTLAAAKLIVIGLKLLFTGEVSFRSLGGPIMIWQLAGMAAEAGPSKYFEMMALISMNLGLINLFPIPILDGGRITFLAVEAVSRRRISDRIKEKVLLAGLVMIAMLMVLAVWNDISRAILGMP